MYVLIMAGGSGTRLWPHSRSNRPKQFLPLNGGVTMLQETVERVAPLVPIERIFIATGEIFVDLVREQLPDLPFENILAEPCGRGTAPCIALAALHLLQRDPDAVMAVLSADHQISNGERFREQLALGAQIAEYGSLVTLGITPTHAATGYGYIERGAAMYDAGEHCVYRVQRFVEKPDAATAAGYLASGNFVWNAGMFVWRADRIMQELELYRPRLAFDMLAIGKTLGTPFAKTAMTTIWPDVEDVAIDVAVMEKTERAVVIPADIGWSDVGDWSTLADVLPRDQQGNVLQGTTINIDTQNTLIYGNGRLVATIGIEDLVIVDTHDVVLICPRDRAQDVKALVAEIRRRHTDLA
ncbi:MAG: mannose-1-phosphate guanylyltransferase [Oscillochloris sp.]|nr:mannose-1-phosphate guanylyltransferase [Oscillochloris sp.]